MMRYDARRALGLWLFIAAAAYFFLYFNGISYMLGEREADALMTFEFGASLGLTSQVLPLLAALPFATGFCADWSSGFTVPAALRSGRKRYLTSKCLSCALSGGLAAMGGMLAFALFVNLRFTQDFSTAPEYFDSTDLQALIGSGGALSYASYYAARLFLQFLAGAFWAMTALAFSAFFPNIPMTLCAPLVFYRLLFELGNLLPIPAHLNPTLLDDGMVGLSPGLTLLAALCLYGALGTLLGALFAYRAGRRLRGA